MKCAYCKKRISWFERLLIKCKLVHSCREKTVNRDYKYAVIAGFRRNADETLKYVSVQQLISEKGLREKDCLRITTPAQKAAYANIIKDLKIITA
jgi:hypothetical protein